MALRFALISDVHVRADAGVPVHFPKVIAQVAALQPRFVVLSGDMTSGNANDGHDLGRVRAWWQAAEAALQPLRAAGIAVLPIAGNHDYYTEAQQRGFREAAQRLAAGSPWAEAVAAPACYSVTVDGLHLSLVHVVDQHVEPEVGRWLEGELAGEARGAALRLCVGHVPLVSTMGRSSADFGARLGGLLVRGGVAAYFAGHEHLVWDEVLTYEGRPLRQVQVSTASASYQFPLRAEVVARHCRGAFGRLPTSGRPFLINPQTREQARPLGFTVVDVEGGSYEVTAMTLDEDERARPFDERALVTWLQEGLGRALGEAPVAAAGFYDEATEQAVRRFQQAQRLTVDGVAGPQTQRRLREVVG